MNKILKITATLFAGAVIALSVSANVKAEPIYYVNDNAVYITDTNNPYYSVKLPKGTAIPANSLVVVSKSDKTLESNKCLLRLDSFNPCTQLVTYRTAGRSLINYTADSTIVLKEVFNYSSVPGDLYLYSWKAQQEAKAAKSTAELYASLLPKCNAAPAWNACAPCQNNWAACWNACVPCQNDLTAYWNAYVECQNNLAAYEPPKVDWDACMKAYNPCK